MSAPVTARDLLAAALRVDVTTLPENPTPETIADWDSMVYAEIIMALEDEIGRELDSEEIVSVDSLADIQAILTAHAGDS